MTPAVLNTLGLISTLVGVVILFKFGFPQPSHAEGIGRRIESGGHLADGRLISDIEAENRRRKQRYSILSKTVLALIVAGTICQLAATWL